MNDANTDVDEHSTNASAGNDGLEALLEQIQHDSEQRRRELQAIASQLPAVQSRRAVVMSMLRDARATADLRDIFSRAIRKTLRAPKALVRRLRQG